MLMTFAASYPLLVETYLDQTPSNIKASGRFRHPIVTRARHCLSKTGERVCAVVIALT